MNQDLTDSQEDPDKPALQIEPSKEIDGIIKEKADSLHVKIIDTQLEIIEALTKDKEKLSDHRHVRVLNEVLNGAATTSLGTKKLAIDAQSSNQQSAMVAFMLSMARSEPETVEYLKTVVNTTPKQSSNSIEPVIDVDATFHPESLIQGQRVITFEEIGKT